ncbi:CDP-alcohol phosphatidyltransferase family protein [bacterium]|nr:CDP-alcohol phosphatidyltransferase family protein [bacterium]
MRNAPMLLTLGNALLGLFALFLIQNHHFEVVIYATVAGAILDGMDGWAARKLGVSSTQGANIDMVSDMISFGIVPAFFVASLGGWPLGILAGILYLLAIGYRLRRFRVGEGIKRGFIGMPSPSTAMMVVSLTILATRYIEFAWLAALAGSIFAILAASRIQFPTWGHPVFLKLPKAFWVSLYFTHVLFFIFRPVEAVLSFILIYMILGPSLLYRYRVKQNALDGAGVS